MKDTFCSKNREKYTRVMRNFMKKLNPIITNANWLGYRQWEDLRYVTKIEKLVWYQTINDNSCLLMVSKIFIQLQYTVAVYSTLWVGKWHNFGKDAEFT